MQRCARRVSKGGVGQGEGLRGGCALPPSAAQAQRTCSTSGGVAASSAGSRRRGDEEGPAPGPAPRMAGAAGGVAQPFGFDAAAAPARPVLNGTAPMLL